MERGNTKHGPLRDEELAQETEGMIRSDSQPAHTEEWRQPEPVDDPRELFEGETVTEDDIELRSELARTLTRDEFPATREELLAILDDKDASGALVERVSALPERQRYASTHEVLEALGLAQVEEESGH
jgi:hypothetical protein